MSEISIISPEGKSPLETAYTYKLSKDKELKATLVREEETQETSPYLSEEERILVNGKRLEIRNRNYDIKKEELNNDENYQSAKETMKKAKNVRDSFSELRGISKKDAEEVVYDGIKVSKEKKKILLFGQQRKQEAFNVLKADCMDTSENRKMIEDVKFTEKAIIIGGVAFSNTQLIPQNVERKEKNEWNVHGSNKKGLWKQSYQREEGYYYDLDAYISECKEQGKQPVMKEDIEKALKALPGEYRGKIGLQGGNAILSLLLGLSMSGGVDFKGGCFGMCSDGFLGCASPNDYTARWFYRWTAKKSQLNSNYGRNNAMLGMFLVQDF